MSRIEPTKYYGAEPVEDGTTVRLADGREFLDANVIIDEDSVEQIRTGYKCIRCHEPQSEPFPEVCESALPDGTRWCNFPIRSMQPGEFSDQYKGSVRVGSRIDKADEIARMTEMDEYEERTGIVLPPHVKFPTDGAR